MSNDERQYRAHLALHGQPLLIEWMEHAARLREGDRHFVAGVKAESDALYVAARDSYAKAGELWGIAVQAEYGNAGMAWRNGACTVGDHTYAPVPTFGDTTNAK